MSVVTDAAEGLKELLEDRESMSVEDAEAWIDEQDVPPNRRGLVLGHGAGKGKKWWYREDNVLHLGPRPGNGSSPPSSPIPDPDTLIDPVDQFIAVAQQLGIPEKFAKSVGFYINTNYNIMEPEQVASALTQVTDIKPAQKSRLLITWTSFTQGDVSDALRQRAKELGIGDERGGDDTSSSNGHRPSRKFVAMDGAVLVTNEDDPEGMSLGEAISVANIQAKAEDRKGDGSSVLVELIKQFGSRDLETLKLFARDGEGRSDQKDSGNTELLMKLFDARLDGERERTNALIERMSDNHTQMVEKLSDMIQQVASIANKKTNLFEDLDESVPGLGKMFLERMLNPQNQSDGGLRVTLPGFGSDGEGTTEVTIDAYERIKTVEQKDQVIKTFREGFPELLRVGERIARSIDRSMAAEKQETEPEESERVEYTCVDPSCDQQMGVPKATSVWPCPTCKAVQNHERQWLNKPVARDDRPGGADQGESEPVAAPLPDSEAVDTSSPQQGTATSTEAEMEPVRL